MAEDRVVVPIDLTVTDIKTGDVSLREVEKSIKSRLSGIAKSAGDVLGNIDTSKLNKALTTSVDKVTNSYGKLTAAQGKLNDALRNAGSSSPQFRRELKLIQTEIENTERFWEEFADSLLKDNVLQNGLNKRDMGLSLTPIESDKVNFFDEQMNRYEAKLAELKSQIPDPSKFISTATTSEMQKLINAYYNVFNAVNKVETATREWNKAKDENKMSDDYSAKIKELTTLEKKLESVKARAAKMSELGATPNAWASLHYDADLLEQKIQQIITELQEMIKSGSAFRFGTGDAGAELDNLAERMRNANSSMQEIKEGPDTVQSKFTALVRTMNNFSTAAQKGIGNVINYFKKLGKVSSHTNKTISKSLKKLWKDLLMFGFGVRSTFFLVRRLRNIFIDSFKEMSKQVPEVNDSISSLVTSLNQIKGSVATAFQPIASYVIPLLNRMCVALDSAMNAVGRFFATLTGQGYIYKFTGEQLDYAESLEETAGAAKKAKKSLMGFDEINTLNGDEGGGGESPAGTWEKEMLTGMSSLAELIKKAWSDGDFTEVGKMLGAKLLSAMNTANEWVTTSGFAYATKIGNSIATLINGAIGTTGLGDAVGTTIANMLNMALVGINQLLTTTNWINLGQFIADWANASVTALNWSLLGQTVANLITAAINTMWKFVGEFDFSALATGISTAINNLFHTVVAEDITGLSGAQKLGQAISSIVVGMLTTMTNTINQLDWSAVGTAIGQVLANIDWGAVAWNFTKLVGAIIAGIAEAFIQWTATDPITAAIATVLGLAIGAVNITASITGLLLKFAPLIEAAGGVSAAFEIVKGSIGAVMKVMGGIGSLITGVTTFFTNFIAMLTNGFSWVNEVLMLLGAALAAVGAILLGAPALVAGVVAGIVALVATLVVVVKDNWNAIVTFISNAWTSIVTFTVNTWNGIVTSISNFINTVKTIITVGIQLVQASWNAIWSDIKFKAVNTWNDIKTDISNKITAIKTTITNILNAIKTGWNTAWTNIQTKVSSILSGIKTTVSNSINSVKTGISNAMTSIKTAWSNGWNSMKTTVTNIWNSIWSTIKGVINSIIGGINGMIRGVVGGMNSIIGVLNKFSIKIPDWVPTYGGKTFGFSLGTMSAPQIPYLAKGAVIPPNKEFMAVLGDQKHGTNIEAPLDTIKQAVGEELMEYIDAMMTGFQAVVDAVNNKDLDVTIGDSAIGKAAERYNRRQALVRGTT